MNLPKPLRKYASKITHYDVDADGSIFVGYGYGWRSVSDLGAYVHGDVSSDMAEAVSWAKSAIKCDCLECTKIKIQNTSK